MKWLHKNNFSIIIVFIALITFFSTSHSQGEAKQQFTIGFAPMNVTMTWMKFAYRAIHKKATELDVNLITYDAGNRAAKQAMNIKRFIKEGVDAIIAMLIDEDSLKSTLVLAAKKGIPVVTLSRSAPQAPYLFSVGSDDKEAGRIACRFIAHKLKGVGEVVVLEGSPGATSAMNRSKGFYDEIKKYEDLRIVFKKNAGYLRDEGYRVMQEALAKVAFNAVYAQNDDMILGAIEAMERAGIMSNTILTIGTDAIPGALKAIREGRLEATIQHPIRIAEIAVEKLVDYLNTRNPPEKKDYLVKPWIITIDNITDGDFYSAIQ